MFYVRYDIIVNYAFRKHKQRLSIWFPLREIILIIIWKWRTEIKIERKSKIIRIFHVNITYSYVVKLDQFFT